MSTEHSAENDARRPLRETTPQACAWCTSGATIEVAVPTPALERRYGRQRYAAACDRHALLHAARATPPTKPEAEA